MDKRAIWIVLALALIVFLWKRSASHARTPDQAPAPTPTATPAPTFGTDHEAPGSAAPDWGSITAKLVADQKAADAAANQASNPAAIADKTDPVVHASNAYYGQFIGKIT